MDLQSESVMKTLPFGVFKDCQRSNTWDQQLQLKWPKHPSRPPFKGFSSLTGDNLTCASPPMKQSWRKLSSFLQLPGRWKIILRFVIFGDWSVVLLSVCNLSALGFNIKIHPLCPLSVRSKLAAKQRWVQRSLNCASFRSFPSVCSLLSSLTWFLDSGVQTVASTGHQHPHIEKFMFTWNEQNPYLD